MAQDVRRLNGHYKRGIGKAHLYCDKYVQWFNCQMIGTFNIDIGKPDDLGTPAISTEKDGWFWLLEMTCHGESRMGWAFRWPGSKMPKNVLEVITKRRLPESWQSAPISINVVQPWSAQVRDMWARKQYWFQTFPWSPRKRADSMAVWKVLCDNYESWSDRDVLDIGAHYGYFAIRAAWAGAHVTAYEPNKESFDHMRIIRNHIEQTDVEITDNDGGLYDRTYDVILYLSVHHQIDPTYDRLKDTIQALCACSKLVFVELILPPKFGGSKTVADVDAMFKPETTVLTTYKHEVRGMRRIYKVPGDIQ